MARDDSPASSTAAAAARRRQCVVKWDRNLKPKLAIMRQCTSVTDRRTDGLASWHKREMYILHLARKTGKFTNHCEDLLRRRWVHSSVRRTISQHRCSPAANQGKGNEYHTSSGLDQRLPSRPQDTSACGRYQIILLAVINLRMVVIWRRQDRDLNPRPLSCKSDVLPLLHRATRKKNIKRGINSNTIRDQIYKEKLTKTYRN